MYKLTGFISKTILLFFFLSLFTIHLSAQKVSLSLHNVPFEKALNSIKHQTGLSLVFSEQLVDVNRKISINVNSVQVEDALKQLLDGTNVGFEIKNNKLYLVEKAPKEKSDSKFNHKRITGIVVDSKGEPIIGASLFLKGSGTGTITNVDGLFSLEVPEQSQITISYIGFKQSVLRIGIADNYKIILGDDFKALDEIVVVGYGTQKKMNLTGAISTISAKDINNRPVVSAANALQGADPAVNIKFGTGSPESNYSIDIRGAISVNSGSPLILVDGIEVSLKQINPNDIESVSILKDASASSIYGAKASAGVVLVTTKTGKAGKAKISYSGRFGWSENTTSTDFITTGYDQVVLSNRFYNAYNGVDMLLYPEANGELQKLLDRRNDKTEQPGRPWVEVGPDGKYYYYANFDWYGYYYNRTRTQQEHNISITGGDDRFNYYVSGRYLNQKGIFRIYGDSYEDYSFRAKMSAKITPRLRYSNNINLDKTEMKYPGRPEYEQTIASLQANTSSSFMPTNPDGSIVQYTNQLYANSPLGTGYSGSLTANNTFNSKSIRNIIFSNQFDLDITKGLIVTASYGYRMRDPVNKYRNNTFQYSRELGVMGTFTSGAVENAYTENRYSETGSNIDIYATYQHTWNDKHHFTAVAGSQYTDFRYTTMQAKQTNLSNDDLASFAVATGVVTLQQNISTLRTLGFFSRVNYDYESKYLIELSSRGDGSSRFKEGNRWAVFPSVSAGWRMSEEKFFEPLKNVWNNVKFRISSGSLGNQQMSSYYPYINQISIDNVMSYSFDDINIAKRASVTAPITSNLTWETVSTKNLGIDMSFLNNRLSVTADLYTRDTKNMLTSSITLPDVYGTSTPKENCANLSTKGYEIYLKWNDRFKLAGKIFSYGATATLGDYLTKTTKFNNKDKLLSDYYEGQTLGEIWGYHVTGLFETDAEAALYQSTIDDRAVNQRVYSSKGVNANYLRAGDVSFADLDGNNIISQGSGTANDPGDKRVIGNSLPRYSYSFRFDVGWNNFDISAFFQGVGKQDWYPASGQTSYDFWGPYAFPTTSFISKNFESNSWTEQNPNAYFPRQRGYQAYSGGALGETNDRYLQNVAYLRFKNLTIGYTVPACKNYFEKIRISLSGENLWYWSPLKKYSLTIDPELAVTSGSYVSNSGVGYSYSKTFSVNLDITF